MMLLKTDVLKNLLNENGKFTEINPLKNILSVRGQIQLYVISIRYNLAAPGIHWPSENKLLPGPTLLNLTNRMECCHSK